MSKRDVKNMCLNATDSSPELLVWEKWIKIRKEETTHLSQRTGREPIELEMNIFENRRKDIERKTVLEQAQIEKKVGVRGSIWEQPQRLRQKCYCGPVYEAQRTWAEIGRPRIIEHIGVPTYVQENEKGITGLNKRKSCTKLDSKYVSYRDKREKDLEENIKIIDPFRPKIKDLIVIGSKPKPPPPKMPLVPKISFSLQNESSEDVLSTVYAVRINNTVFVKDIPRQTVHHLFEMQKQPWHITCDSWSYYFNCPVKKVGRSKLFLQNLGTVTLRYCWKKIKTGTVEDLQDPIFFFNKNENVICPGQSQDIFITFLSSEPGAYKETWEIFFLNICFFNTLDKHLTINLEADSTENMLQIIKKIDKLENIIFSYVLRSAVRDMLWKVFEKATSVEQQIYPHKKMFLEAEMFIMKNPVCFYHQTEVMKMKGSYQEMLPNRIWDLSISSWRAAMMGKDYDERMKYYDTLKISNREFLRPWYEKNDLIAQKYTAVKNILGQFADTLDEEYARIPKMIAIYDPVQDQGRKKEKESCISLKTAPPIVSNIFFLRAYEHLGNTMELCAGVLSSLDLNRWIHFDFCRT